MLGEHLEHIVPVQARRLNSKVTRIRDGYNDKLDELYDEHGVWERLEALAKRVNFHASKEAARALENMDCLTTSLMLCAKKRCQKLNSAHYEFSLKVKEWLDR